MVPALVVATAPVPLPKRSALDWTFAQPVPPLATGRMPVTSLVRETEAQVATPAPFNERTNWLVQEVPAYSENEPSAPASGMAEVRLVTARLVVVACVLVAFTVTRLVMVLEPAFTKMPSPAVSGER